MRFRPHYSGLHQAARAYKDIFDGKTRRKLRLVADADALLRHITGASCEQFLLDIERQMSYTGFARATATIASGTATPATSSLEKDGDSSVIEAFLAATRSSVPGGELAGSPGVDDGDATATATRTAAAKAWS